MAKSRKSLLFKEIEDQLEEVLTNAHLDDFRKISESERELIAGTTIETRVNLRNKIPDQESMVAIQHFVIHEVKGLITTTEVELEEHAKVLEKKQGEYNLAEQELEKAKERMEKAKSILKNEEELHTSLERELEKNRKDLEKAKKSLAAMQVIAVVHSTASLKQVNKYQLALMIVLRDEAKLLESIKPDEVFEPEAVENFIQVLPRGFEKHDEKTRKNLIDFCNLVINIKMVAPEDQKVVALFSNQEIAEILRLNGLEDFR